ncbi:MAG: hypothetical protein AAGC47_06525 [Bacteroidota bacterium]
MKTLKSILTLFIVAFATTAFAQGTTGINYQAVVRDGGGNIVANQTVSYRLSINEGSAFGTTVYSEDHSVSTDDRGLVNMIIGDGSSSDDFSAINWGANSHFLEVEIDTDGGNDFINLGTSELNSVPYALHAATASNVDDADADPTNELQDISLSGNTLSISDGNSVTLPSSSVDDDAIAKAWAHVNILGQSSNTFDNYNITSVSNPSTGVYVVQFTPGLFSPATNPAITATVNNDLSPGVAIATFGANPSQVTVRTYDMNGNLSARGFSVMIFGK